MQNIHYHLTRFYMLKQTPGNFKVVQYLAYQFFIIVVYPIKSHKQVIFMEDFKIFYFLNFIISIF